MRSLLDLISKHTEANSIIPIIAIGSIIATIILYVLIKKMKWIKYVINLTVLIIGVVVFYNGYKTMLTQEGLDFFILGAKFIVFGAVGLFFSAILDILDSLAKMFTRNKKKEEEINEEYDLDSKGNLGKEEVLIEVDSSIIEEDNSIIEENLTNNEDFNYDKSTQKLDELSFTSQEIKNDETRIFDEVNLVDEASDETKVINLTNIKK